MTTTENYEIKQKKEFVKTLTEIINNDILPTDFGKKIKTLNIEMGLFTSNNYGSYKISFFDENEKEICYIIADNILNEYKVFKTNNNE